MTWSAARKRTIPVPHAGRRGRPVVSAFLAIAFAQDDAGHDVLSYMPFPREHRSKLRSTNPIKRLHAEIKHRTNVVGIFRNEDTVTHLMGAVLLEQNDEWAVSSLKEIRDAGIPRPVSDNLAVKLVAVAA